MLSQYLYYLNMEKKQRQIQIGYLQTYDSNVIKLLDKGFANARQNLVMKNHIQDTEIVSIKKDAIFTTKVLEHVNFGNIHFSVKNKYDLFCHLNKLEIYFIRRLRRPETYRAVSLQNYPKRRCLFG